MCRSLHRQKIAKHRPGPTLALLALLAAISISFADAAITVPIGGPLNAVSRVWLKRIGDTFNILKFPDNVTINNRPAPSSPVAVDWVAPQWQTSFEGVDLPLEVFAPTLVLATPTWRISLQNNLPFQRPCSCGCNPGGGNADYCLACELAANQMEPPASENILGVLNGFHDLHYTNIHTHGLKADVGLKDLFDFDPCKSAVESAGLDLCTLAEGDMPVTSTVDCDIFSDNVYATVVPGSSVATNTYNLPAQLPGCHWVHAAHAGGGGARMRSQIPPPLSGTLIVPDMHPKRLFAPKTMTGHSMDYYGVRDWCDWKDGHNDTDVYDKKNPWRQYMPWDNKVKGEWDDMMEWDRDCRDKCAESDGCKPKDANVCSTFQEIIGRLPNFSPKSDILTFTGLYFRIFNSTDNSTGGTQDDPPSDDTIPFLACNALPPDDILCPGGLTDSPQNDGQFIPGSLQNVTNNVGLDWVALNGAIQPTLTLTERKYSRWQMVNTMTTKWLDLTIAQLPNGTLNTDGSAAIDTSPNATDCKMWLLAHDGVYLEHIPRLPQTAADGGLLYNDVIVGPGNHADVLVKCNTPGRYVLYSGAGPLRTFSQCAATHCELFGSNLNENNETVPRSTGQNGNSLYEDAPLLPALLAVIEVEELCGMGGGMGGMGDQAPPRDSVPDEIPDCAVPTPCSPLMSYYYCTAPGTLANATDGCRPMDMGPFSAMDCGAQCISEPDVATMRALRATDKNKDEKKDKDKKKKSPPPSPPRPRSPPPPSPSPPRPPPCSPPPLPPPSPPRQCLPDPELSDEVFTYNETGILDPPLNQTSFPVVCMTQGYAQNWNYSGFAFHPIHLHESPIRFHNKPMCLASGDNGVMTNFWEEGDWWDTVFIPSCTTEKDVNALFEMLTGKCEHRYSGAHCHVLAHEDEGCMTVVWWKCPTTGDLTCDFDTQCVYSDGLIGSAPLMGSGWNTFPVIVTPDPDVPPGPL
ncbi:hypothetical protein FOA52_005356 [Chlamydomonas sp. UWO 241]|nr:hypothetical protein FOA52_005356 [Chlamydomonas sp. UWO 241]